MNIAAAAGFTAAAALTADRNVGPTAINGRNAGAALGIETGRFSGRRVTREASNRRFQSAAAAQGTYRQVLPPEGAYVADRNVGPTDNIPIHGQECRLGDNRRRP
ncbi:MAG: hypothetical protein PVH29_02330 [Candidatus Zixiibacteriota bacterium]|jgi:hypothetical protein